MGLKLRAELEVRLTTLALLVKYRCLYDEVRGLPCSRVKERKSTEEHRK